MREIKFRGKRVDNGEWVYGYLQKQAVEGAEYYITWPCTELINNCRVVIPKTIGQFTGLYDKNDTPIYDGDIIDIHQTINGYNQFVIEYKDYGFSTKYYNQKENKAIRWYEYDLDELFDVNESEKELEVIGNIHDKERE